MVNTTFAGAVPKVWGLRENRREQVRSWTYSTPGSGIRPGVLFRAKLNVPSGQEQAVNLKKSAVESFITQRNNLARNECEAGVYIQVLISGNELQVWMTEWVR